MKYLLAHDIGTSGDKAVLYDTEGRLVASHLCCYPLASRPGGIAEQNPNDWWRAVIETTRALLSDAAQRGITPRDIAAVSFSGQMMGCLCVDKNGTPLRPAMIWADMRASEEEAALRAQIDPYDYYRLTGHRLSSAYSAFKLMWLKKHEPEIYARSYKTLCAKDYIIFKLTGRFVTDFSDASGTGVWDLSGARWSEGLIDMCGLDGDKFPEALRSIDVAGEVTSQAAAETGLEPGTPVVCGGGDGPCAAVGTGCVDEGEANSCLGTSSWLSLTSSAPLDDPGMCAVTWPHLVPGKYMPCGAMQCGGGSFRWATEILSPDLMAAFPDDIQAVFGRENELIGAVEPGSKGLIWLPHLLGERSPRWNPKARGAFIGLTYAHTRAEMLRTVMEGVALNLEIILSSMRQRRLQNKQPCAGRRRGAQRPYGGRSSPTSTGCLYSSPL
jgi:xylulokinase